MIGIYKILNKISNKCYIGCSTNIKTRWNKHRSLLSKGCHHSGSLQEDWNKLGKDSFEFIVLEILDTDKDLYIKEIDYINNHNDLYNREQKDKIVSRYFDKFIKPTEYQIHNDLMEYLNLQKEKFNES